MKNYWWTVLVFSFVALNSFASQGQVCKPAGKAEENGLVSLQGKSPGQAVIFGKTVTVPSFNLSFRDAASGKTIRPDKVSLAYGWKWLEYPYPEHPWGAWSDASDMVECTEISGDVIEVPQFKVNPRGWYNGKYVKFPYTKNPTFTGIDVVSTFAKCTTRVTIMPKDVNKLDGKTAVVKVTCNGESTITYEK